MSRRARSCCAVASHLAAACRRPSCSSLRAPGAGAPRRARHARVDVRVGHAESRLRVGPGRPAPGAERRQALFEFVYQTYDSSAWIPQSLFDSNLVTQAVVGDVDTIVGEKVGLVLWRDNAVVPAFGMAPSPRVATRAAAVDGQLPRLPHGGDRRRRVFRRRHEDVRRAVARRGAEDADQRAAGGRCSPADPDDARDRGRRQPHPEQPPSRQDRLADARAIDGVRRVARRALHAPAQRRDAAGRRRRPRRRQDAAALAHRGEDAGRAAGTPTAASTATFR